MERSEESGSLEALLRSRRSCRAFLPKPVDPDVIRSVLELACLAPSGCNAQPWIVHVVSGAAANRLRATLTDQADQELPFDPDVPITARYPGLYRGRQIGSAVALFEAQKIDRSDLIGRKQSFVRNFAFFDAPHVAFLFLHESFSLREALDCGLFAQSFMLALAARGLASCAQGALSQYASAIHTALDVPCEHHLLVGIAFGHADDSHCTASVRPTRAPMSEIISFHNA